MQKVSATRCKRKSSLSTKRIESIGWRNEWVVVLVEKSVYTIIVVVVVVVVVIVTITVIVIIVIIIIIVIIATIIVIIIIIVITIVIIATEFGAGRALTRTKEEL